MKFELFFIFLFFPLFTGAQISYNVELIHEYNRGDERYSGSWYFVDEDNREYALIGAKTGTAVYLLGDTLSEIGFIPGPESNWREITVLDQYAYVVTEGLGQGQGMQIIDLSAAPDSIELVNTYDLYFNKAHIIQKSIFEESPYIYVAGADTNNGVHIFDCSEPEQPELVGLYDPGYYIHDIHVRDTLLFAAAIYNNLFDIVSIAEPSTPTLLNSVEDPGNMTHSFSTSPDMNYLFVADEDDGYPMRTFNISDIYDVEETGTYTANEESLVHNPYTRGIFTTISHNTEGLRILDSRDPELLYEVGYYDTYEGPSGGFSGLWSACPYLPSGKIIGADRTRGLLVWSFNDTQAARLYGKIVDAETGLIIENSTFTDEESINLSNQGSIKWVGEAESYQFEANAPGYDSEAISFDLSQGDSIHFTVELSIISSTNEREQEKAVLFPNPGKEGIINIQTGKNTSYIVVKNINSQIINRIKVEKNESISINFKRGIYIISFFENSGKLIRNEELIIH